ncbi:phospholipase D/nuclease [Vararia minispora EC-137]|uniref:Phospholipase D/nuclease n=1 Tax=Vararia minispora EC-137 TaxID=1314806 RepID=A0ACB8Q8B3_9AGAM|nr:phospholipase D/nuclease [Vararia minispora EC-137]
MSFLSRIADTAERLVERIPEGIQATENTIIGLLDTDRRHDDPEEKRHDEIRAAINASHRFQSFAGEREQNFVKWHIDGQDYFWALSELLDSARECIFILDWWLTPELYLRRPPAYHPEWRLDRLLKRKAEEGVKIYVVVYKEVTQTMSMSSNHTKKALEALHPNIACMRHPDHIGSKDDVEFWSHHEKVVVVDNHRACIGGLDICFGRWDTNTHPLADVHPTDFARTLFPGQDYNNARILDFQKACVDNYISGTIDITTAPRMPWHDVHMTLVGPVVLDIVQHFTERWNEIKKRKYAKDARYDWLAFPHNVSVAPNEPIVRHPHLQRWHAMGHHFRQRFHLSEGEEPDLDAVRYAPAPHGTCRVQVVRSVSDWSHGVLTEHSIQNAYKQLILEANHYIYIENQFFISSTRDNDVIKNTIAAALVERIVRAAQDGQKFHVVVVIPEVPGFAGDIKSDSSISTILAAQYRTINRGGHSIYEEIRKAGFEPSDYIRFYNLRVYDRINAPRETLLRGMEERSGIDFNQAQVALARQWVGDSFDPDALKEVTINVAPPTSEGMVISEKTKDVQKKTYKLPATTEEAVDIIRSFEQSAEQGRRNDDVSDTVGQHALLDRTALADEKWLGTEQEELDCFVSELSYIHTKLMIVDDRRVIMGSANLNDRSQRGDGDSEIALVVEDEDMVKTTMDGKPYMAARFAASLRRKLYRQHLGFIEPQIPLGPHDEPTTFMHPAPTPNADELDSRADALVADPLAEDVVDLWRRTAHENRRIFTELFRTVPTNLVRTDEQYKKYVPKVRTGHVVPGTSLERVKEQLALVRGSVVEASLDFLIDDKDFTEGPDWIGLNPTLPIYI